MKVLVLGPSLTKSKGGITSVSQSIAKDSWLNSKTKIDFLDTYVDGNKYEKISTFVMAIIKLMKNYKCYNIFHFQMASQASFFRKAIIISMLSLLNQENIIIHIHGGLFNDFYNSKSYMQQKYIKYILSKAKIVLVLSEVWARFFREELHLKNIQILNNGVDIEKYSLGISKEKNNNKKFLFLGRLEKQKGIFDLLETIRQLDNRELTFYIAGNGNTDIVRKITKFIDEYNLTNCKLLGWINDEEKIEYLSKVSTLVLPSYIEGLPVSILEAMAAKKVVIATNIGGIPSIINSDTGILIEPGNIRELLNSIKFISDNPAMASTYAENAYSLMKNKYSLSNIHRKLYKYYKMLT